VIWAGANSSCAGWGSSVQAAGSCRLGASSPADTRKPQMFAKARGPVRALMATYHPPAQHPVLSHTSKTPCSTPSHQHASTTHQVPPPDLLLAALVQALTEGGNHLRQAPPLDLLRNVILQCATSDTWQRLERAEDKTPLRRGAARRAAGRRAPCVPQAGGPGNTEGGDRRQPCLTWQEPMLLGIHPGGPPTHLDNILPPVKALPGNRGPEQRKAHLQLNRPPAHRT
jgi:hypothetical protein